MKLKSVLSMAAFMLFSLLCYIPSAFAVVPPDGSEEIPLDGGLGLLVAAGIVYGAKKAYDKRKKEHSAMQDRKETL